MAVPRTLGLLGLYIGAQLVALALAYPFRSAGLAATTNPNSPTSPLFLIAAIVIAPLVILALAKVAGGLNVLRVVLLVGIGSSLAITLSAVLALAPPAAFYLAPYGTAQLIALSDPIAAVLAVAMFLALLMEPQWYVVDLVGFVAAGGLIAILGLSFGPLPAFLLLGALAVYDYIAVYRTKHMISLAEVVTELKLPILMVMPTEGSFDYTKGGTMSEQRKRPVEEREAVFMGLGDVVIPGTLVVSAFLWLPPTHDLLGVGANLWVGLGVLAGSLLGYAVLMRLVAGGNPQAGLPFLNGGALVGYVVTFVALYHSFGLGLGGGL